MSGPPIERTGTMATGAGRTWYRVVGDLRSPLRPLVICHGGPAGGHRYLRALDRLGTTGRPIVHYDQIGCGASDRLADDPFDAWTMRRFVDELDALLQHLGITGRAVLLGHSWGGMVAAEHAAAHPNGQAGPILMSAMASSAAYDESRLRREPREARGAAARRP